MEDPREQLIKLLDDPRNGLQISSKTNKVRRAILDLFAEIYEDAWKYRDLSE